MLKNLDPKDISIKPFKSFKNFTFTNNDSGSGVWLVKARSGSMFSYVSSSDSTTSIVSGSVTTRYFALPTWHTINKLFYKDISKPFNVFSSYDSTKQKQHPQNRRRPHGGHPSQHRFQGQWGGNKKTEALHTNMTTNGTFRSASEGTCDLSKQLPTGK